MGKIKMITRRELYERRWIELTELLPILRQAAADFAEGRIRSYALTLHNVQRDFASLKDLLDFLKACELEWEELDNVLHGRGRRIVEHHYYQNPTNIRYWG